MVEVAVVEVVDVVQVPNRKDVGVAMEKVIPVGGARGVELKEEEG